jgi:hypothetical protein
MGDSRVEFVGTDAVKITAKEGAEIGRLVALCSEEHGKFNNIIRSAADIALENCQTRVRQEGKLNGWLRREVVTAVTPQILAQILIKPGLNLLIESEILQHLMRGDKTTYVHGELVGQIQKSFNSKTKSILESIMQDASIGMLDDITVEDLQEMQEGLLDAGYIDAIKTPQNHS